MTVEPGADPWRDSIAETCHALNNMLGVIRLTSDLLEQGSMPQDRAAAAIRDQVDEAARTVEQLHRAARGG